jgi:hypothetical protein
MIKAVHILIFAFTLGGLLLASISRFLTVKVEVERLEAAITESIREKHHEVYEAVKERIWEEHIKPSVMYEVSRRMILDTGKIAPTIDDITKWIKEHPNEVIECLELYKELFPKKK